MAFVDYYKTLEITKSASEAEIKKAYKNKHENSIQM
jgi:DnaJ-class molecular chaperone